MTDKHDPYKAKDTGHVWDDDIRELDNPPPRWWILGIHLSWISILVYCILYPSIPLINDSTKGILGWTQIKEFKSKVAEVEAIRKPYNDKIAAMTAEEVLKDAELLNFAQISSRVVFGDFCAPCHGAGGQGGKNYPVLADDDWLYGGSLEAITKSITNGRIGDMPGHSEMLTEQEINDVVKYVAGLSTGQVHEAGKAVYMGKSENREARCYTCHGRDGKGKQSKGAPDLTDAIWRFDGSEAGIKHTIVHGVNYGGPPTRKAKMPAFNRKLSEIQIKKLALMVYQFSGGQ
ncbi:MAG: cytochrome-c oxidase, cbb3-type subunit III [Deltaproteobacteria bacterium]|nr:cytochrome-c oxidase, cbb3-type subunit III [Deltaproteobacteria bacterium]